jgi:hypothetical protein
MKTPYDWITIGIFAGLIVLFMQRSTAEVDNVDDPLWMYLAAGGGCGLANYLGNNEQHLLAILAIAATLVFIMRYLKPFASSNPR